MNGSERWIWMELIGFDNTKAGCGAFEYLDRIGFVPEGMSLLLSSSDFVFLHESGDHELFPDICSRQGHEYNEDRARQVWRSTQLRTLIAALQSRGVKVFFTISMLFLHNEYHREWCSRFGGGRVSLISRPSGFRVGDCFAEKLQEVLRYYGFDGYHISDGVIPDGNITDEGIATYTPVLRQFNESVGGRIPESWFAPEIDPDFDLRRKRGRFIRENFQSEWLAFIRGRWTEVLDRVSAAVHGAGKLLMMNTVAAKGIFETLVFCGFDMRLLPGKVDILVVENVATSMALITGDHEKIFDFAAITMEMRAMMPEMKILNLTGCKDVVESFDTIRNAPAALERDVFVLANLFSGGRRCADGVMYCLGDGIRPDGWKFLETLHRQSYAFPAVRADGWTLYCDGELYDRMQDDYLRRGSAPSYIYAAELMKRGVEIFNVTASCDDEGALLVPNSHFLAPETRRRLTRRGGPVLLLGESGGAFTVQAVNCPGVRDFSVPLPAEEFDSFARFDLYNDRIPLRKIPEELLTGLARIMREMPGMTHPLNNPQENFLISARSGSARRCGIGSRADRYTVADCTPEAGAGTILRRVSGFPVHDLQLADGKLVCRKARSSADYYGALRIPPRGIFIFDMENGG